MELNLTGRPSGHGDADGFENLTAVMIDGEKIGIDNGAIHGKSNLERGINFRPLKPEDVPNGRPVHVIWVTLKRYEGGMGFNGLCASTILIDEEQKIGYKPMGALVNQMSYVVKGKIDLQVLSPEQREKLAAFLNELRPDLWENTSDEVKREIA
ncbi:MAG TPA: YwhD family protein [Bacilli bacterium]|nr:YwhD family protein [Bacilli bacterium]